MILKLLPLSLYVEMRDLLLLLSIIRGDYDVDINDIEEAVETTRQSERCEYRITKARIYDNDNFFRRTKLLFNYVSIVANDYEKTLNKIFTENTLEFFHTSLCGREQMHLESDLQIWKLQHTKQDKTDLN